MWLLLRDYFLNYLLRFPSIRKPREQVEALKNKVVQAAGTMSNAFVKFEGTLTVSQPMDVVLSLFLSRVKFGSL